MTMLIVLLTLWQIDKSENVDNVNNVDEDDNGKPVDNFDIAGSIYSIFSTM